MKTEPKPRKKTGRPRGSSPVYDRIAVMTRVCGLLSSSERGTTRILKEEPGMPAIGQIWEWMAEKGDDGAPTAIARRLVDMYARAKQFQAEYMASLLLEICDDSRNDYIDKQNRDGSTYRVLDPENIQRSRVRIDTRKWLMAKLHPRVYADSLKVGGDEQLAPVKSETMVTTDNMDALREALKKHLKA